MCAIQRSFSLLAIISICAIAGCTAAPSARDEFEAAQKAFDTEQAKLDSLMPAYATAKQTAKLNVIRELAGATADETLTSTLGQLGDMTKALQDDAAKDNKAFDLDATIDQLTAKQNETMQQIGALTASAGKANEVKKNIETPGTPENKRYEEVLGAMPEAQAYERQKQRVERAKKLMDEAEAKLPK